MILEKPIQNEINKDGAEAYNFPVVMPPNLYDITPKIATIHKNVSQDIIITTRDKASLRLLKLKKAINFRSGLYVSGSNAFALLIVKTTVSDFGSFLGFEKQEWAAIFSSTFWVLTAIFLICIVKNIFDLDGCNSEKFLDDLGTEKAIEPKNTVLTMFSRFVMKGSGANG